MVGFVPRDKFQLNWLNSSLVSIIASMPLAIHIMHTSLDLMLLHMFLYMCQRESELEKLDDFENKPCGIIGNYILLLEEHSQSFCEKLQFVSPIVVYWCTLPFDTL